MDHDINLKSQMFKALIVEGALTIQNAFLSEDRYTVATVRLSDDLVKLAGTKYDPLAMDASFGVHDLLDK